MVVKKKGLKTIDSSFFMSEKKDLNWLLEKELFNSLAFGNGPNLFVLDTSVIIDLEDKYYGNGQSGNRAVDYLTGIERSFPLLITPGVFAEFLEHREKVRKGNRYEISRPTSILMHSLYDESIQILQDNGYNDLPIEIKDFYRYYVRLAFEEAFKGDTRKYDKDSISEADVEIISMAYGLSSGNYLGNPIEAVNILSPDRHIARVVSKLRELEEFKKQRVRVIPTRNDLRSFLR